MAHELYINRGIPALNPTIIDDTDSTYTYYGYEAPNSDAGALTQCSIKRVGTSTNLEEWAEGDPYDFQQAWDDRATDLNYSTRKS